MTVLLIKSNVATVLESHATDVSPPHQTHPGIQQAWRLQQAVHTHVFIHSWPLAFSCRCYPEADFANAGQCLTPSSSSWWTCSSWKIGMLGPGTSSCTSTAAQASIMSHLELPSFRGQTCRTTCLHPSTGRSKPNCSRLRYNLPIAGSIWAATGLCVSAIQGCWFRQAR